MRRASLLAAGLLLGLFGAIGFARAAVIVNDTWIDGDRTDPASPIYSENGVDTDADGNIESAWYNAGTGAALSVIGGALRMDPAASSASWTTYVTPEATPIALNSPGDSLKVTWVFTTGDVNASNTSQNFRIALVDSPASSRISADDNSPGSAAYKGYSIFGNMGETTGNGNSFQLRERSVASGDLLSTSGNWTGVANGLGTAAVGYGDNIKYTFTMTLTRDNANGLNIATTMAGGNIGGTGSVSANFADASPNSFVYDTFALRPSNEGSTATFFDTSTFLVEFTSVPEPSALAMVGLASCVAAALRFWKCS